MIYDNILMILSEVTECFKRETLFNISFKLMKWNRSIKTIVHFAYCSLPTLLKSHSLCNLKGFQSFMQFKILPCRGVSELSTF
ncbi:hypothetical protein T4D_6640 [Trichinella pseudospiralis]|uniref:Uncharacterized protein n=1 Tax=Trichinella pseudospiralis TaxID=6337 RepID=A0A0V1FTW8_TRIPS|nr:hypothetical protein T4D_6640 [Trichinella pseudospiralis]